MKKVVVLKRADKSKFLINPSTEYVYRPYYSEAHSDCYGIFSFQCIVKIDREQFTI